MARIHYRQLAGLIVTKPPAHCSEFIHYLAVSGGVVDIYDDEADG